MERLTKKNWRNLDPWETCGQDNYCKRGCHEQGGCTKGCIVPRIYARLAAYEDTGLEPQDIISAVDMSKIACALHELNAYKDIGPIDHIRDLIQDEKDGRLVVLPQKTVWELTMDAGPDCDLKCPVDAYDEALGCDLCSKAKLFAYERPCTQERLKGLGKTVFLTREEAEATMKEGQKQI